MKHQTKGTLMLLLTAFIWGAAFVAQKKGMEYIGPFTFNGIRSFIGAVVLVPLVIILVRNARLRAQGDAVGDPDALASPEARKNLIKGGLLCGLAMFMATSLQQVGLLYTTSGKSGFITAMYIIIVPFLGILIGKKVRPILWLCVVLAAAGLYLLTMSGETGVNKGDVLTLICAVFFSFHIQLADHFSPRTNAIALSSIQLFVVGLLSVPFMALFETVEWAAVADCTVPILYAGVMSCGIAYTLQLVGQKYTDPTFASLLLSLEAVFALLTGMIILGEMLSGREFAGCAIMFFAIVLAQLPSKKAGPDFQ